MSMGPLSPSAMWTRRCVRWSISAMLIGGSARMPDAFTYRQRVDAELCGKCGHTPPARPHVNCQACLALDRRYYATHN
jgi:hypothetical protein